MSCKLETANVQGCLHKYQIIRWLWWVGKVGTLKFMMFYHRMKAITENCANMCLSNHASMQAAKQSNQIPHCRGQRLLCIMISVSHNCRFWVIAHPCSQSGVWIFALVTLATVSPDQMLQMWKNLISSQVCRWWYVSMSSSSVFFFNLTNYPEQCILRSLIYLCFRRTLCLQPWWSWLETAPSPQ